jgi:hypothetical protein
MMGETSFSLSFAFYQHFVFFFFGLVQVFKLYLKA